MLKWNYSRNSDHEFLKLCREFKTAKIHFNLEINLNKEKKCNPLAFIGSEQMWNLVTIEHMFPMCSCIHLERCKIFIGGVPNCMVKHTYIFIFVLLSLWRHIVYSKLGITGSSSSCCIVNGIPGNVSYKSHIKRNDVCIYTKPF